MRNIQTGTPKLAIEGGTPVRSAPMPKRRAFGDAERRKVEEAMAYYQEIGQDLPYGGKYETEYGDAFTRYQGGGNTVVVATGSASCYVALRALELPEHSEVLVSPITDPGTLNAIILQGLRPRLMDTQPDSYNVGPEQVVESMTGQSRAIVLVHSAGIPADARAIATIARERGLQLFEDCSQAHGARLDNGDRVGTAGSVAAFSTMYRKAHISGSSGGLVYSRDQEIYRRAILHSDRGKPLWDADFNDRHPSNYMLPAHNWNTDELSCAIGISSLGRLDKSINDRLNFVEAVRERISARSRACSVVSIDRSASPFFLPVLVGTDRISCTKREFALAVQAEGIDLNPHYGFLVSEWPWIQDYLSGPTELANARRVLDSSFCLYLNENYTDREAEDVILAIEKVEDRFCA
ncbi:DegT/DnrJ/EryC1/StrS family aminotransferase [Nisaea sediminum]|uniref:DegT/DnrJ/EryC1/StrS family aminotransferase n=1 Tax=Nisaea sediminum TaxID=2775867 RepID=UPI001867A266|nr:DegT/DnrJ/EryC1/StrS aminotransferase family protein [Nisaea sediminum]